MSTARPKTLPPLEAGQRLDRATFHERYEAMPSDIRAELVGGIVCMPSPLFDDHGGTDENVSLWLGHYRRFTPGLRGSANATTLLGRSGEVQPDHQLRIRPELGGQARVEYGYVTGPPELIVEVARSSKPFDLGPKVGSTSRPGCGNTWSSPWGRIGSIGSSYATAASRNSLPATTASIAPRSSPASGSTRPPCWPRHQPGDRRAGPGPGHRRARRLRRPAGRGPTAGHLKSVPEDHVRPVAFGFASSRRTSSPRCKVRSSTA